MRIKPKYLSAFLAAFLWLGTTLAHACFSLPGEERVAPFDFDQTAYEEIALGVFTQIDGKPVFRILKPVRATEADQIIPLDCNTVCFSARPGDIAVYSKRPHPKPQKTQEEITQQAEHFCKEQHQDPLYVRLCVENARHLSGDCKFSFIKIRHSGPHKNPNNIQSMSAAFGFDVNAWLDGLPESAANDLQNTPPQTDPP